MCSRDPYLLWVGCSSHIENDDDTIPLKEDIFWSCFITAEVPFFKGLFKKIDTTPAVEKQKKIN